MGSEDGVFLRKDANRQMLKKIRWRPGAICFADDFTAGFQSGGPALFVTWDRFSQLDKVQSEEFSDTNYGGDILLGCLHYQSGDRSPRSRLERAEIRDQRRSTVCCTVLSPVLLVG